MFNPKISVVMPVLNRGDMIEKAICSVLDQQYPNVELIILDGGSTDNTLEVIKQYEKHITYWHSQYDGSASAATNIGIEKASGDLIALLMSDDYYELGLFQQIAESYNAHPDADIFSCAGRIVSQTGETLVKYASRAELDLTFYNICYGPTGICFRFIKKSLHDAIGLYIPFDVNNQSMLTNDKEFLLRAVLHGVKNQFVNYLGYTHVAHEGSYSFGNHRSTFERHCTEHIAIANDYLLKSNLSFQHTLFLIFWYHDQSAKLFLFKLLEGKFRTAFRISMEGIRKYTFLWPVMCCYTGCRVLIKRCIKLSKSIFIVKTKKQAQQNQSIP
jgi:glycosyltransferase involved in cell wall biosynthesis